MNYIKLINAFWQLRRERDDFDPYVISLYFALVDIANRNGWENFTAYREDIILLAGMSHNSYYKARKVLQDAGLIEFTDGANKLSKCCFTILSVSLSGTQQGQYEGHNKDTSRDTAGTQRDTILDKLINNKTIDGENFQNETIAAIGKTISNVATDTLPAKNKKPTIPERVREAFEVARKRYPGKKLGESVEWENFKKKHSNDLNFTTLPDTILKAIEAEERVRNAREQAKLFVAPWANFATWINQRRWEQEFEAPPKQFPSIEPAKRIVNSAALFGELR